MTPFYTSDSRHWNFDIIPEAPGVPLNITTTTTHADRIAKINTGLTDKLKKAQELAQKYYNKYYLNIEFKVGDSIILKHTNIKTKKTNKKLNYKKLGPYHIQHKISLTTYVLDLPQGINIMRIIYINNLK